MSTLVKDCARVLRRLSVSGLKHPSFYCTDTKLMDANTSQIYQVLTTQCLKESQAVEVLKYPGVSDANPSALSSSLSAWLRCQFGEKDVSKLILKHPYLLLVQSQAVLNAYTKISALFAQKYIFKVFYNSPNVVVEPAQSTEQKLHYLETCGFSRSEIANRGGLQPDLIFIKMRLSFLIKTGNFKVLSKKASAQEREANPKLDTILFSDDAYFAQKLGRVKLIEYEVYQQMYNDEDSDDELCSYES